MSRADDDALSWRGDDDPTLDVGADAPPPPLPAGYRAVGKGSDGDGRVAEPLMPPGGTDAEAAPVATDTPSLGNGALVAVGVLAGIYLLYSVGWLIGGLRLQTTALFLVSSAAYIPALILATLAPALWFVTVYLLTRGAKAWVRFVWLAAGVIVLLPWPFVMIGAIGL